MESVWQKVRPKNPPVPEVAVQSGTRKSIVRDYGRLAPAPGKRISANGKVYYEYRKNRTDLPGQRL